MGAVVGGIARCYDLGPPAGTPPTYIAGKIEVYRGEKREDEQRPIESVTVADNAKYTLELPPGLYVLIGTGSGTTLWPPPQAAVIVIMGQITLQDLDYQGCM
jgi:hypothetical protein